MILDTETIALIAFFGSIELSIGLWVGYRIGFRKGQGAPLTKGGTAEPSLQLTPDGQALLLGDQRHELPTGLRQALRQGDTINAIKTLRSHFPQLSLNQAKTITDALNRHP